MENLNDKNVKLANLIFPEITKTVEDLEKIYPKRDLKEGAFVTRFAPSPTGFLHTGALFTSLINQRIAKQSDGIFYLRIEDTDKKREVDGSVGLLTSEMKIFGIYPDEGVISDTEEIGNYGPYTQSKREEIYKICAKSLIERGLAYPCFCTTEMLDVTRTSQEKNKIRPGYYSNYARCRNISIDESIAKIESGEKYIIRFRSRGSHLKKVVFVDAIRGKMEIAENDQDIVIIKSDGLPTYHFAHIVDDHFMKTTHVMRGEEWIPSTPIHIELFNSMNFEVPTYVHFPSVMIIDGESKRKLSKRKDKEAAVSFFLDAGYPVDSVLEYILTIVNSDYEPWRAKNPLADKLDFDIRLEKINSSGALFDQVKLNDISKEVIAKMNSKQVLDSVLEWSKKYDIELYDILNKDLEYSIQIFAMERDNATKIRKDIFKWEDIKSTFVYFFDSLFEKYLNKNGYIFEKDSKIVNDVLSEYISIYNENDDKDTWFSNMKLCASKLGFCTDMKEYKKNPENYIGSIADFSGIIRMAITGKKNTPDIYSIMKLLGKDRVINRLNNAK
ncbi:MAG: glutamate--tRNA ligase [Clostridia bacterium]|nr:glutamate--tRNA ligase [Clostridia bacterium]